MKMDTEVSPGVQDPDKVYINQGEEDQMEIKGYAIHRGKQILTWTSIVLTVGLLRLVFHWKPEWMIECTHTRCDLHAADTVILKDQYKRLYVEKVEIMTRDGTRVKVLSPSATFAPVPRNQTPSSGNRVTFSAKVKQSSEEVELPLINPGDDSLIRFIVTKKQKYLWNSALGTYEKLGGLEEGHTCAYFHEAIGLTELERIRRRVLYGYNSINVHVTPIFKLLFTQMLNPFYVFQAFSVCLWFSDEYYYYASCIVLMSAVSLTISLYETRKMQRDLKSTISGHGIVTICTNTGEYQDIPSDLLVPGDIIEVPRHGCVMQCDAVLISGNCIVNESMLTGESVPVTKTPLPNPRVRKANIYMFSMKEHSRHVLFCGTHVIQTRYYGGQRVRAVVLRTGFATTKGELVRSILYPKPTDFKFSQDAFKFIGVLALIASFGMIYTMVLMNIRGVEIGKIALLTLDLITIVIPPALPAAMTVGIVFAQNRLKRQQVYCISQRSINLTGAINVFCFDKTGTLTEDGLDMWGVVPSLASRFENVIREMTELGRSSLMAAMATCHSLTIIEGQLTGDPLDLKMFESTGWELEEPGEDTTRFEIIMPTVVRPKKPDIVRASETFTHDEIPYEIGILRQFTFSSRLQRMSVITRVLGSSHFDLYAKGSPEMITSLCKPDTVPSNFHDELLKYTQLGYRVIALAYRSLHKMSYVKMQKAEREKVECGLTFLGLLIMENRLKPETTPIIRQLKMAQIRTVMVTGDNMLTALSVARDCQMIDREDKVILVHAVAPTSKDQPSIEWTYAEDHRQSVKEVSMNVKDAMTKIQIEAADNIHLAITGKSWDLVKKYFPDIIPKLAVRGTVFARMSPDQKMQLIECLQEVGYYVGMCGDGANDCGALKTAHAGISLSEAEASVASPFTSKEPNISCVPTTIREGRAALVTSFGVFKYMACYSLTQFASVCLLYWVGANLTDFGFLWIDLFLLTTLSITFGYTTAYPELVPKPPTVSLLSFTPLLSIFSQMIIIISFQVFVWFWVQWQPWFEAFVPNEDYDYVSYEVTVVTLISAFQYITSAIVLSKGAPYRKTIFSNYAFLTNLVLCTAATAYLTVYPFQWLVDLLELRMPESVVFRALMLCVALANFFLCFIVETFIVDSPFIQEKLQERLTEKFSKSELPYRKIEEELTRTTEWPPPISQSTLNLAELMRLESVASISPEDEEERRRRQRTESTTSAASSTYGDSPAKSPSDVSAVNLAFDDKAALLDNDQDTCVDASGGGGDYGIQFCTPPTSPQKEPESTQKEVQLEDEHHAIRRGDSIEDSPIIKTLPSTSQETELETTVF